MGCCLTDNFLKHPEYDVSYLEVSPQGGENLRQRSVSVADRATAVPDADVVILGVPDVAIGAISEQLIPMMKAGAPVLTLDPAAPSDGVITHCDDLGYVIAHPRHPSVFNWEPTEQAFRDFYGGISLGQAVHRRRIDGRVGSALRPRRKSVAGSVCAHQGHAPDYAGADGYSGTGDG